MKIPFTKAHGARNDFLLTWRDELPAETADSPPSPSRFAIAIPASGADGWLLVSHGDEADAARHRTVEFRRQPQ